MSKQTNTEQATAAAAAAAIGFTHHLMIGTGDSGRTFVTIAFSSDGRLSLTGVEGPKSNGDARGSAGQILMSFMEYDSRGHKTLDSIKPADGWTAESIRRLFDVWEAWSGNHMQPGCEHQRAEGWGKRRIDPSKPLESYGRHVEGQQSDTWNMLAWVTEKEHPCGLLSRPCPTCGYKYGSRWLTMEVPAEIVEWLRGLPTSDGLPTCWQR